ncbi:MULTISPECIES: helix-turn-helix domain-containing protein [Nocardia]|uniref:helix-turn-helix domain-containing protein n=1 Tax=Nocardia TaxID=1817 RepID=UPI0024586A7E|nr:helix-turn-helix transcriptional regulator [Nocardia wallacei]
METDSSWWQSVAIRVRAAIARSGMTEEQVGKDAGIANATLSRSLNGHRAFTTLELQRIAEAIGTTPDSFAVPCEEPVAS